MYHSLEIECPNCRHRFTWLENAYTGSGWVVYRRKGYDEELRSAFCPKCNIEMAVIKEDGIGVDIRDKAIEISYTIRGI